MVHMPTSKNLGGFHLYGSLMVLTSLLLGNSHCHLTVVEPKSETSSSKSPNTLSLATGLPVKGEKWSKIFKANDVPWTLLFRSRTVRSCNRGLPASMLKPRWHNLLMILKQFVTCEGRYGFVFLFHLRLLMVFMGFELSLPHYLH